MDTCIYMAVPLHCSPETITILLISYIPTQNKKFLKSNKAPNKYLNFFKKKILNLYNVSYYNIDLSGLKL